MSSELTFGSFKSIVVLPTLRVLSALCWGKLKIWLGLLVGFVERVLRGKLATPLMVRGISASQNCFGRFFMLFTPFSKLVSIVYLHNVAL